MAHKQVRSHHVQYVDPMLVQCWSTIHDVVVVINNRLISMMLERCLAEAVHKGNECVFLLQFQPIHCHPCLYLHDTCFDPLGGLCSMMLVKHRLWLRTILAMGAEYNVNSGGPNTEP